MSPHDELCTHHWLSVIFPGTTSFSGGSSTTGAVFPLSFLPLDAID